MHVEFFPDGDQDCPAILFYGCPSAGAEVLIATFRSLAEDPDAEVALHELPDVDPVGAIQVFATNMQGRTGVQEVSPLVFRWRKDREGWLEAAELAEPVEQSNPRERTSFQYLERYSRVNVIFSTDRAW
jgi:hypothetical protein